MWYGRNCPNHAHPPRQRFDTHLHRRHCFSRARSHHLIPRTDRVDAACSITHRRPHGRSHVSDRHGQEDAGEVNGSRVQGGVGLGTNHPRGRDCSWICSHLVHCVLSATNECDDWRTHILIRLLYHLQSRRNDAKTAGVRANQVVKQGPHTTQNA